VFACWYFSNRRSSSCGHHIIEAGHVLMLDCHSMPEIAGIGAVLTRLLVFR